MWQDIENRIAQNDSDSANPRRQVLLEALRTSGLVPGGNAKKYLVDLQSPRGDRIMWEIRGAARNFFFDPTMRQQLEAAGFVVEARPHNGGSRFAPLNNSWAFGSQDCVSISIEGQSDLAKLAGLLMTSSPELVLRPEAISRWIKRLQTFFPNLDRFDRPDIAFDERERSYKIKHADELKERLAHSTTDEDAAVAIHSALAGSNLLQWRAYWAISPKGDANRQRIVPALAELASAALGDSKFHPIAVEAFVNAWLDAVPNPTKDAARQIGEFLMMHLSPSAGVYIRHTVREDLYLEAVGKRFPQHASIADTYAEEGRFMRAVFAEFTKRGLAPRDMIDIQSALWVVHNYGESEMPPADTTSKRREPENLILYGPPGTGKTFNTVREAVRLCLGLAENDSLLEDPDRRKELHSTYRSLLAEERIEFVTFHQSFSYEDFLEGLRPTTELAEPDSDVDQQSAGFSLKPHEGVFKRISERARLDTGGAVAKGLDRSRAIFKVSLGRRETDEARIQEALDNSIINLRSGSDLDWSNPRFDEFDEILREWRENKDDQATGRDQNVVQMWSLRASMQIGDYVVLADGRDRFRAFGRVTSEYYYDPDATQRPQRRRVEWLWQNPEGVDRSAFYPNQFRGHSIYQLTRGIINWDALEAVVLRVDRSEPVAGARDFVLIIDEINRANISKVFGELITLIEVDKRLGDDNEVRLKLPYSGTMFGVPANLHIVGTMNTADRSIALLDTALRRRFTFRELMPKPSLLSENLGGLNVRKLLATINDRIEYLFDREHQIGHAYLINCVSRAAVEQALRHRIIPLLSEYFYEDWSKVATVLGDGQRGASGHFISSTRIAAPAGVGEEDAGSDRLRWTVNPSFDFSEFEV
jgi:5-methylcytosine-specific restriction protein B